ncbi:MAG: thiamine diphosphokinase [Clostridiaceae bacterium]|nr:thiamine diphosphokinase [Clostridiaceae bacterium]
MNVLIIGNGSFEPGSVFIETVELSDLVVCADGGARHLYALGIKPDVLVGDFDSIPRDILEEYKKANVEIIKYPVRKDMTDVELAIECAVSRGASRIFIFGAFGTRIDHTLSNLHLLHRLLDSGIEGVLFDEKNAVYLIDDQIKIKRRENHKLSLLPAAPVVEGIYTEGLAYPLKDAVMKVGTTLGISNEFTSDEASVSIRKGRLFIIVSRD